MVEEMRWGLEHLGAAARAEADRRVLEQIFLGPVAATATRMAWRIAPGWIARAMARLSPLALGFLVGEIRPRPRGGDHLPSCAFRAVGGASLCEHVCRRPTEDFCAARAVPVRLRPRAHDQGCDWSWKGARE